MRFNTIQFSQIHSKEVLIFHLTKNLEFLDSNTHLNTTFSNNLSIKKKFFLLFTPLPPMFNQILSKLKTSKPSFKLSLDNIPINTQDLAFRLNPRQFRLPTFSMSAFLQAFNARLSNLPSISIRIPRPRIAQTFKTYATKTRKAITKRSIMGSIVGTVAMFYAYEYNPFNTNIRLSYQSNAFNDSLVRSLSHLHENHFYPSPMAVGSLLQAIFNKVPPTAAVRFTRENIPLPDGGQITLDWTLPTRAIEYPGSPLYGEHYPYQPADNTKIMFIIHGLTGGSETHYIQQLVDAARRQGYRPVVMNQRGVNQALTTPMPFHGGYLNDLEHAIAHVKKKYPDAPMVAVGTSFGGNQLMRYMGSEAGKNTFEAGVLLSAPFDLDDCVDTIQDTVYEEFFIRSYFEKNFLPNVDIFQSLTESHGVNLEEIMKVKSLRDYHSLFTVKLYEHKDVREYFLHSKIFDHHIKNVNSPLLVLHAKDDPIACAKSIPVQTLKSNPNIIYAETTHGGHLCWFSGVNPQRWYDEPTVEFLDRALALKQNQKKEATTSYSN